MKNDTGEIIKSLHPQLRVAVVIAGIVLTIMFLQAWISDDSSKKSETSYKITDERYAAGLYSAGIEASVKTEGAARKVLNEVMKDERHNQDGKVHAVHIRVYRNDDLAANAKLAYDKIGLQQAGLDKAGKWAIDMY